MSDVPSPPPARRRRMRTLLRYGVIGLVVVFAGLFFARREIGNLLARELDERLSAAGVFVAWRSADWVPGPGIRLHDLALYRDAAKRERIALLGNVTAIKGDPAWDRWDTLSVNMADAPLTLGSGEDETRLEHVHMHLWIQPGKAELRDCRASLQGLGIEANGVYVNTAAPAPAKAATKPATQSKGLFNDVSLYWLKSVKEWVKIQPEKNEPVLKVEFRSRPDGSGSDVAATLDGGKFRWRGQKWDLLQAAVKTSFGDKNSPVEFEHVRIGHAGRTGEFAGTFDPARGVLRIGKLDSGIDVLALARALVPDAVASLGAVATTGGWRISGEGEIPVDRPGDSRFNARVALDGDFVYAADGTRLALQKPAFELQADGKVIAVSAFKAALWGGTLDIPMTRIHLPSAETKPRFETQAALNNARLQSVMSSFSPAHKQPGLVQCNWKGGGGFELTSITGSGALSIREAEFFRIPLLGPLHLVFDRLTPGFGKDVASTMTADHRMAGGTLHIDNLKLESKLTRIEANGSIDLNRQYAHLTAKAKLQGIAGLATALLSALLEVEGEGPVSDVRWKLNKVPGAELIGDAANAVGKTGGAVIEGAGSALKGTGKAAKDLLKLPGRLLQGK